MSPRKSRRSLLVGALLLGAACGLSEIPKGTVNADAAAPPPPTTGPGGGGTGGGGGPAGGAGGTDARVGDARADRSGGATPRPPDAAPRPMGDAAAPRTDGAVPPPPSGTGVMIGGMQVPKEKAIVFLHIGHSNMAGRTDVPAALRPFNYEPHPQLWAYNMMGAFVPAKEPLSGDFLTRGRCGPGMSILRTGLTMAPDAMMISIGHGHDGSRGGACKNYRRGGLLYEIVMGPAKQLKGKVTFGGIFSMLVLMEIYDKPNLPRSHECMEQVAADMRADLGDPEIPFLMSDWEMGATGRFNPTLPDATLARAQLKIAQQNIARSVIISTEGLPMSDDHHFDLTGYKMWAERAFALIKQNGWDRWAAR